MRSKSVVASAILVVLIAGAFWWKHREAPSVSSEGSDAASDVKSDVAGGAPALSASNAPAVSAAAGAPLAPLANDPSITPEDRKKDALLETILKSRNDNDPRLDTELRELGAGARKLMRARYSALAPESRNERGTIVFLVGRALKSESDLEFMAEVLAEPPCRSLGDCSRDVSEAPAAEDLHHEAGNEVTLAYPQLTALKALERNLAENTRDWPLRASALAKVREAEKSPIARVSALAREISARFGR